VVVFFVVVAAFSVVVAFFVVVVAGFSVVVVVSSVAVVVAWITLREPMPQPPVVKPPGRPVFLYSPVVNSNFFPVNGREFFHFPPE